MTAITEPPLTPGYWSAAEFEFSNTLLWLRFNFLADGRRWCINISTKFSFLMVTSILISPLCNNAFPQPDDTPPLHGCVDVLWIAIIPLLPPNTIIIMAKHFSFCFFRIEDILYLEKTINAVTHAVLTSISWFSVNSAIEAGGCFYN